MNVDFIIVGQGIAGTSFAFELIRNNKSFVIVDKINPNSASRVALGIYNPLILKWFTKAWDVDNQLEYFYDFYNSLNSFLDAKLFSDSGIYKYLKSPYDQNNWLTKQTSGNRSNYMSDKLYSITNSGILKKKNYGIVNQAGKVNVKLLLDLFRRYCIKNNILIDKKLNYNDLRINSKSIHYEHVISNNIIFCQGYAGLKNPFFNNLNLKPTKGEIVTIHSKDLNLKHIIHAGFLLCSINDDDFAFGATYDWKYINHRVTKTARKILVNKLESIINVDYQIIDQVAGIRPSTTDRRPLIGSHSKLKNLHILNGLGTRGILLAPYMSKCLVNNIYNGAPIMPEADVNRYL